MIGPINSYLPFIHNFSLPFSVFLCWLRSPWTYQTRSDACSCAACCPPTSFRAKTKHSISRSQSSRSRSTNKSSSQSQSSQSHQYDFPSNLPFDNNITSRWCWGVHHTFDELASFNALQERRCLQASLRATQSQAILPSQTCQRFKRLGQLRTASISGTEILSLAGRMSPQVFPIKPSLVSSEAIPAIHPLRGKEKFTPAPDTLRHRPQQGLNCPGIGTRDSLRKCGLHFIVDKKCPFPTNGHRRVSIKLPSKSSEW